VSCVFHMHVQCVVSRVLIICILVIADSGYFNKCVDAIFKAHTGWQIHCECTHGLMAGSCISQCCYLVVNIQTKIRNLKPLNLWISLISSS